jgi:hypothetical protein
MAFGRIPYDSEYERTLRFNPQKDAPLLCFFLFMLSIDRNASLFHHHSKGCGLLSKSRLCHQIASVCGASHPYLSPT